MAATMDHHADHVDNPIIKKEEQNPVLTPPASEGNEKTGAYSSDLSDLDVDMDNEEDDEDIGNVEPAYYYEGGKIPVFEPTMKQFKDFKKFIAKIDKYGMKSGIVKIVPPKEWRESLPQLDEQIKTIRVKNPITQEFHGAHGTYTQANMEKQRSYNLPQWRALCEESNHQPPARRGERRRNQEKVVRGASSRGTASARATRTTRSATIAVTVEKESPKKPASRGRGRGRGRARGRGGRQASAKGRKSKVEEKAEEEQEDDEDNNDVQVPPTPTSPMSTSSKLRKGAESDEEGTPTKSRGRQPKSVTSRRKNNRSEQVDVIDEAAFKNFNYRIDNQDEWTAERCQELETAYWKGLTFNNPMYGADMPGSLFDDTTTSWNVAKLPNLLDVIGQKVPGVNTAYLYLGMWKATFAWHLEDVDLYSINYIHFGAPKQWYSISQADARRFESAMKNVWPQDAKNCDQFLRHKTYLISPQILKSQYNIEVNRLVHNEGEFVITYPYGYHSGYNLGYNCAESVNFATEEWLEYGRIAKKCNCEADSVWIDVWDIERRLRGEPTPEYYEETDDDEPIDLPSPPASETGKKSKKRKREIKEPKVKPKKIRLKLRSPAKRQPCLLCPNDYHWEELLPADNDKGQVHRRCAEYLPETWVSQGKDVTIACGVSNIGKARHDLKCYHCKAKHGAAFQCSFKKCIRAYHATCAFAAGVQVDQGLISVYDENGTEYADGAFDFRCRFHRHKRPKYLDRQACTQALEDNYLIRKSGPKIQKGEIIQWQYWQSDIFAGLVLENRTDEKMLLVESIPAGYIMEVEYKWVLVLDKAFSHLQPPSDAAKPLPAHLQHKNCATEDPANEIPKVDEPFFDANSCQILAEFTTYKPTALAPPTVDLDKEKIWHYIYRTSSDTKAQYSGEAGSEVYDPLSNFLARMKPPKVTAASGYQELRKQTQPAPSMAVYSPIPIATSGQSTGSTKVASIKPLYPDYHNDLLKHYSPQNQDGDKEESDQTNHGIFIGSGSGIQNFTQSNNPWIPYGASSAYTTDSSGQLPFSMPVGTASMTPAATPRKSTVGIPLLEKSKPSSAALPQAPEDVPSFSIKFQPQQPIHTIPKPVAPSVSMSTSTSQPQTFRFREQYQGYRPPTKASKTGIKTSTQQKQSTVSSARGTDAKIAQSLPSEKSGATTEAASTGGQMNNISTHV